MAPVPARKKQLPTSAEQIFAALPSKWAAVRNYAHTEADVASLMISLDETVLAYNVLSFETGRDEFAAFIATDSGIWEPQRGTCSLTNVVRCVRARMHHMVLTPLVDLCTRLRLALTPDDSIAKSKLDHAEKDVKSVLWLHNKLGGKAFVAAIVHIILQLKTVATRDLDLRISDFDTRDRCIAFSDGIYDFSNKMLVSGHDAHAYYVTKTVGFSFADMMAVDDDDLEAFDAFFAQIQPKKDNRDYLLGRLHNAARKVNDQIIIFHYNITGSNGKSTWFNLVELAFGDLFVNCNPQLLVQPTLTTPSAPNEELMSVKGCSIVLFSEPSSRQKLHTAFLKKISGGDKQSTRANYGSKETFKFAGLANVLCNKIPLLDDMDGGTARRVKCLPYESSFVDAPGMPSSPTLSVCGTTPAVGVESSKRPAAVFLRDKTIEARFPVWKMCLLRRIIEADPHAPESADVQAHTRKLISREDVMARFVKECIVKSDRPHDFIRMTDVWNEYKQFCILFTLQSVPYNDFTLQISQTLGEPIKKSGSYRNFWRGITLVQKVQSFEPPPDDEAEDPLEA